MQTLKNLRSIFNKGTKIKMVIIMIAIIFGALIEMFALALMQPFMTVLLDGEVYQDSFMGRIFSFIGLSDVGIMLAFLTFLLLAVYILKGLYILVLTRVQRYFIARQQAVLSSKLLGKTLNYSYLYHADHNIAQMQNIIVQDVNLMFLLINSALLFSADFFMAFFILMFLLVVSPVMTLAVLVLAGLCIGLYFLYFRKRLITAGEVRRTSYEGMLKSVNQALGSIKEVKIMNREEYFKQVFTQNNILYASAEARRRIIGTMPRVMIESICFGGVFALFGVVLLAGTDVTSFIVQMSIFVVATFRLLPALNRQATMISDILYYRSSISSVYEALHDDSDGYTLQHLSEENVEDVSCEDIEIKYLTFKYPRGENDVLRDVCLSIPPKQSVAFIGSSGAGKTTLADLILGVISPQSGGVYYNGKSIHHNFKEWSKQVGYIPQQIYMLDETIRENVAFGINRENINEEKVWRALQQAQLVEFVKELPDGLDTVVGDRGIRLSGGQRQRIGIARAMYEDPPILVLDEATSSLDNETEQAVMEAVMGFKGNKTMIIIAHRLSTIQHCDMVYRVENKQVIRER